MDASLAAKYPLARKAFDTQDIFYARTAAPVPDTLGKSRNLLAVLVDKYVDADEKQKEALIIAGAISLEPFSGAKMYGDPDYGSALDTIMIALIDSAKNPGTPVPPSIAPLVTILMIVKMEETVDAVSSGKQKVTDNAVRQSLKRAAANDEICLPNLQNQKLRDLYEVTQFAYFGVLENAAFRAKNPPIPPAPKV